MFIPNFTTIEIIFKKTTLSSEILLSLSINLFSAWSFPLFQYEWNSDDSSYKYTGILWGSNLLEAISKHLGHSETFFKILISSSV